jgi:hypothetical protein
MFSTVSRLSLEPTQPPIQWVLAILSTRVKKPGRESDHSPPSTAKVKNGGAIPPLTHTSLWHVVQLITHTDKFTFCVTEMFLKP